MRVLVIKFALQVASHYHNISSVREANLVGVVLDAYVGAVQF